MTPSTWDQVVSWRLRRGHLSARVPRSKLTEVASRLCGIHAQIMTSVALTLATRVSRLGKDDVDSALADNALIKTWAMRGTLHVFTPEDLPLYCAAQFNRDQGMNASFLKYMGLEMADMEAILEIVPAALDGKSLSREELAAEIARLSKRPHLEEHVRSGWGSVLKPAAFQGLLCFGPPRGRSVTFARPDQLIGGWTEHDPEEALAEVTRRFLTAYGPASRAELARWWGVRPPEARRMFDRIDAELTEVEVDGTKRWMLSSDLGSFKRAKPAAGVRLLWSFDQLLVMSAPHSEAIVDPEHKNVAYTPKPIAVWSLPVVLIDGRVGAGWRLERKTRRVVVSLTPVRKLPKKTMNAIEEEAQTVGAALGLEAEVHTIEG